MLNVVLLFLCEQMSSSRCTNENIRFRIRSSQRGVLTLPCSVTTFAEAQAYVEMHPQEVPWESHYVWQYERVDQGNNYRSLDLVPVVQATTNDNGDGIERHINAFQRILPLLHLTSASFIFCDIRDLDHAQFIRKQIIAAACGTHEPITMAAFCNQ